MPLAVEWTNLHQILRSLYADMLPLCSDMMGIAKGLAGLVTVLLLVYAAVALMILFGGMRSRETSIPAVEHLRQPLLPERSLLPLNTSEDDTQER